VPGLPGDAEAGVGIVLVSLTDLTTEAEVARGIVWVERDVLQGVKEVRTGPRGGEVAVIFIKTEQSVRWWLRVRRRLGCVLREDRLAPSDRCRQKREGWRAWGWLDTGA